VVIDVTAQANQSATLLGEAEYLFQDQKKLLADASDRFDRQYGASSPSTCQQWRTLDWGVLFCQRPYRIAPGDGSAGKWRL
jgi:hypothetical protein